MYQHQQHDLLKLSLQVCAPYFILCLYSSFFSSSPLLLPLLPPLCVWLQVLVFTCSSL